jgi:hypothetical protein
MTTENPIRHILLIPADGDAHGLLREGPCGSIPPAAERDKCRCGNVRPASFKDTWRASTEDLTLCDACGGRMDKEPALVIAWNGEIVQEGLLRANTATLPSVPGCTSWPSCPSVSEALKQGKVWAKMLGARLVVVRA